jgi:RNA polymerase sigma-70 factor, ECF subfamily
MRGEMTHPATDQKPVVALADAVLVARARGDRTAFAPLYDRYFNPVFRFCFYRVGDWQEAEDAAADVFANVLASLARFREGDRPDGFRCWLFTIARNVVANRRRGRRFDAPLDAAEFVADAAPTPEESALVDDDHRLVRTLLARLNPDQRDLLELRLAGLNDAEIARVLGRSHDAVRKEQSRAIQRLRSLVHEAGSEAAHD